MASLGLLAGYGSSSGDEADTAAKVSGATGVPAVKRTGTAEVVTAPAVAGRQLEGNSIRIQPGTKTLSYNPRYEDLYAAQAGPQAQHPSAKGHVTKNMFTGFVEEGGMSSFQFEDQRRTFGTLGYALDPSVGASMSAGRFVGNREAAVGAGGDTIASMSAAKAKKSASKRKRKNRGDPGDIDGYKGPWAAYEGEQERAAPTEEEMATMESWKSDEQKALEASKAGVVIEKKPTERSTLHIKDPYDYQGRSFLHPPTAAEAGVKYGEAPERCFLPKRCIHTWSGHTKGVAAIRFFPVSAHLLLSAGMDGNIKLWEVYGARRCVRTYHGHTRTF